MASGQPPLLLIVDDDPYARDLIHDILSRDDYRIAFASSGGEGLALAQELRPDLILLDVMMPGMDGFSVCRHLRANPETAVVPVVMITALDDRISRLRGIEAGTDDFLNKPIDSIELRARVRMITQLNRYRRLLEEQQRATHAQARLSWALNRAGDGYLIIDRQSQIVYANAQAQLYLGASADAPIAGRDLAAVLAPHFHCEPATAWADWLAPRADPGYLVRPANDQHPQLWLAVELSDQTHAGDRLVRLCDVSAEVVSQQAAWSLSGAIAHKLRTPLVGVIGSLGMIEMFWDQLPEDERRSMVQMALGSARTLHARIEQVLRLSEPAGEQRRASCPARAVCELGLALGVELGLDLVARPIPPQLDAAQLAIGDEQIELLLRELLINAQKFHPQQAPHVILEILTGEGDSAIIRLTDDGVHLAPELQGRVWKPFYQAEPQFTGQVAGMGTGLAMIARIVGGVGGRCLIANRNDRPGVMIGLQIPLARGPELAAAEG
jgi:DNA-binding response OmpR family regulator